MEEQLRLLRAASAEFERVVRELPASSWHLPTPAGWSVRELVEHVVQGNELAGSLLSGVDRGVALSGLPSVDPGPGAWAAVAGSARRQARAFAAAGEDQPVAVPGGAVPARAFLRFRLVDLVVHAWDLLRAAELDETLAPAVVDGVWRFVEPHLDAMLAQGVYGPGPSGRVPSDAAPQQRLLDAFGRRP
jgi:uncharacterized protein (TIGR03086 family)